MSFDDYTVVCTSCGLACKKAPPKFQPQRKGEREERELPKLQCEALRGQGRHVGGKRGDSARQKELKHTFYIQAHH